jgi:hypothetical protein
MRMQWYLARSECMSRPSRSRLWIREPHWPEWSTVTSQSGMLMPVPPTRDRTTLLADRSATNLFFVLTVGLRQLRSVSGQSRSGFELTVWNTLQPFRRAGGCATADRYQGMADIGDVQRGDARFRKPSNWSPAPTAAESRSNVCWSSARPVAADRGCVKTPLPAGHGMSSADTQHLASHRDQPRSLVLGDPGVLHSDSFAKYAVAVFWDVALYPDSRQLGEQSRQLDLSPLTGRSPAPCNSPFSASRTQLLSVCLSMPRLAPSPTLPAQP